MALTGQSLRGYDVLELLGEGSYGSVYRSYAPHLGGDVALKHIEIDDEISPAYLRRFDEEANDISSLRHPHIVTVYESWREPQYIIHIMQFVNGGTLDDRITAGPTPLPQAVQYIHDIAEALQYAHTHGIVHRDVKPKNILLDTDGVAYLADFDIAKSFKRVSEQTRTMGTLGTPAYAAPEQTMKDYPVGPHTDIFALGIVAYQLLTGKHPYHGSTSIQLQLKLIREPMPSITKDVPDLPIALDAVLAKAAAKRAPDRYASALEFAEDLAAAAGLRPPGAGHAPNADGTFNNDGFSG
jgi:eukaryotic-like serine/threonine-protein kinase